MAKALVSAGVTKKPRTKKLYKGRLSLLNALSDAFEQHTVENVPKLSNSKLRIISVALKRPSLR